MPVPLSAFRLPMHLGGQAPPEVCLKVPMTICAVTLLLLATASSASNTAMGTAGRNALGHGSGAPTDGAGESLSGGGQKYTEHPATFCAAILCHVNSEVNSKTCT